MQPENQPAPAVDQALEMSMQKPPVEPAILAAADGDVRPPREILVPLISAVASLVSIPIGFIISSLGMGNLVTGFIGRVFLLAPIPLAVTALLLNRGNLKLHRLTMAIAIVALSLYCFLVCAIILLALFISLWTSTGG